MSLGGAAGGAPSAFDPKKLRIYGLVGSVVGIYLGAILNSALNTEVFSFIGAVAATRMLQLGNRHIELRHGTRWQLFLGKRPAGQVIRALSWLGPEAAPAALKQLRAKMPDPEWAAVLGARAILPSWMAKVVSEVMQTEVEAYG